MSGGRIEIAHASMSSLTAQLWYDDRGSRPGWVAEYYRDGELLGDSEKIEHPNMPVRRNASTAAERIVRRELRAMAARV